MQKRFSYIFLLVVLALIFYKLLDQRLYLDEKLSNVLPTYEFPKLSSETAVQREIVPNPVSAKIFLASSSVLSEDDHDVLLKAFHDHPYLKTNYVLMQKTILTEAESQHWTQILTDKTKILQTAQALATSSGEPSEVLVNIERINFLNKAFTLKDNPERGFILNQIETLILQTKKDIKALPLANQRHFAGDKIELLYILKNNDPEAYLELRDNATNPWLQHLILYAEKQEADMNRL